MPQDHDDLPAADNAPAPTAADFDQAFSAAAASPGIRRVWQLAEPDLPPQIEPFSFVSAGLLGHVAQALDLSPGQTLADLQDEARHRLPVAELLHRITLTATAPDRTGHEITIYGWSKPRASRMAR